VPLKVVVVWQTALQMHLAIPDLLLAHFAYFQKAAVNQAECYEGLRGVEKSL
jgi:hypothetical protein